MNTDDRCGCRVRANGCELSGRGSLPHILFQACAFALLLAQVVELPTARPLALPGTLMATVSCFLRSIPGPIQRGVRQTGISTQSAQPQILVDDPGSSTEVRARRRLPISGRDSDPSQASVPILAAGGSPLPRPASHRWEIEQPRLFVRCVSQEALGVNPFDGFSSGDLRSSTQKMIGEGCGSISIKSRSAGYIWPRAALAQPDAHPTIKA